MPGEVLLEAHWLTKRYGGLAAVDDVDLRIRRGQMTAVIGPNGAGKSTLFALLAGATRPTHGRVLFDGRDVTRRPTWARARLGLMRTFQLSRPLLRMTVEENLMLAPRGQLGERPWAPLVAGPRVARQEAKLAARVDEALAFFEIEALRDAYAGSLSGGQRKLLELARVLMAEPRLVLLDEPLAGVNPTLAKKILDKIAALRNKGDITFVLIEHDLASVFARCDPVIVMAQGKILAQGAPHEVRADPKVVDAYLGA